MGSKNNFTLGLILGCSTGAAAMVLGCGDTTHVTHNTVSCDAGVPEQGGSGGTSGSAGDSGGGTDPTGGTGGTRDYGDPGPTEPPTDCENPSTPVFNVAVNGTTLASDSGGDPANVFDDNTATKWEAADHATPWIAYEFAEDETYVVVTYSVSVAGDILADDPRSWELQGSEDGPDVAPEDLAWTTLDAQTDQTFEARYHTRFYSFSNDVPYHRYRFLVTEAGADPSFQISELQFFEEGTPVVSIDDSVSGMGLEQFDYSDGWTGRTVDAMTRRYHGTSSWNNTAGESVTFRFEGSRARVFGVLDPKHGIGSVTMNGVPAGSADFYGSTTVYNQLVYESPWLCPGTHELTITVAGDKRPASSDIYASLDRIQIVP